MADPDCKWCGGTGQVRLLSKLVPCDCDETNTTTTTKQRQIGARISPLGPDRREYAFVAEDSGWGTKYIWEVYSCATSVMIARVEPANGQPDDFYRRFIFTFPYAEDWLVRLVAHRGADMATTDTRIKVH